MTNNLRIGHGYDVHKFVQGRKFILGGVCIPYEYGLLGHSDADALTHAIIDALFGASGMGDIGLHFPDSNESYKDIDSMELLRRTWEIIKTEYNIINMDCTIILEKPKLALYKDEMCKKLAETLKISPTQVNIKAKTEEGLGFTGAGQGIAVHAVCLLAGGTN